MSSELRLLDDAVATYVESRFRTDLPAEARERSARRFRDQVVQLDGAPADALAPFVAALASSDAYRRNAAARALVDAHAAAATEALLDAWASAGPPLDPTILRRLGRQVALPDRAWQLLAKVRPFERAALTTALLRRPSPQADLRWDQLVDGDDDAVAHAALDAAARWGTPDRLVALLARPRRVVPPGLPAELRPEDIRLQAAFRLGLTGSDAAIDFLLEQAATRDAPHAAGACVRLGWLGWPASLPPIARLLRGRNTYAAGLALDAAAALGAAALGPALLDLAERSSSAGSSLPDDALRALAAITGQSGADPGSDGGSAMSQASRRRASMIQRTALADLDARLRYHAGEPLTLRHLAGELVSIHAGEVRRAAHALHAITGDDVGFDPDDDLIGNLDALDAWRARASGPAPVGPGGWAFHGRAVAPPGPVA